ncbi:MAG: hypothetical protein JSV62_14500 [Promethearchaeota archaeon]|nr:MAG: hypothetical protein JSV62_14500 [Candidatus Lokiarchaeota archaeon]
MEWKIKFIFNFTEDISWNHGYAQFGFHDYEGNYYAIRHDNHWLGQFTKNNEFPWTGGSTNPNLSSIHIPFDLKNPMYISKSPKDKSLIISSRGNNKIYKLFPGEKKGDLFIDMNEFGVKNIGNCVFDKEGNIWINEITGCRIWQFDSKGQKKKVLGNGKPGFQKEPVNFDNVQFNWIYDIRLGPDNNLYILDSRNYAVRMIDIEEQMVYLIAGTGEPGYSGDGGLARKATFGSDINEQFDGPWSISLDELGNIFVGDTHNHVVRMIERKKKKRIISTIAGTPNYTPSLRNSVNETDPFKINLPKICSMDYYNKELFIPEWDGDLIVLEKNE